MAGPSGRDLSGERLRLPTTETTERYSIPHTGVRLHRHRRLMLPVTLLTAMSPSSPVTHSRSKATLFCPDCGHEGHVGGDWSVDTTGDRTTTACPECGARIDDRRVVERSHPERPLAGPAVVRRAVGTSRAIQKRMLEWWTAHGKRMLPTTG
jgi:predicted RNA-binding Zn-ribbon protein involved in translation (DUF1610 family)